MEENKIIRLISTAINSGLKPYLDDYIKREVEGRVRTEAMQLIQDEGGFALREMLQKAIKSAIEVEVKMRLK